MVERDPERLLTAYRSGLGPSRAAEDRMLASLQAQIVALPDPSVTSGAVGTSAGAGAGGGVGAVAGVKLAAVVLVVSVGIATVAVAKFGPNATTSARVPVEQVEQVESHDPITGPIADPLPEIVPAPAMASERVEPSPPTLDVPSRSDAPRPRVSSRPRSAQVDEVGPAVPLADEAKLLRNVDAALRAGDLAAARTQLEAYRQTLASGSLRAQADELELLLACADKLDGASTRALAHLHAHPDTRARARIEDACGQR